MQIIDRILELKLFTKKSRYAILNKANIKIGELICLTWINFISAQEHP